MIRHDGSHLDLTHPLLDVDSIRGTIASLKGSGESPERALALSEIQGGATRKFSAGRTLGLVGGVFAGLLVIGAIVYQVDPDYGW